MSSTMYSRSVVMLEQAKHALTRVSEDDAYLDAACFETQQAVEFLMKAILLDYGVPYEKTHDIRFLASKVASTGFQFEKADTLELLSDTITDWEEGSRYGKGVHTTVNTVQRVQNIYKSMNEAYLQMQQDNNPPQESDSDLSSAQNTEGERKSQS